MKDLAAFFMTDVAVLKKLFFSGDSDSDSINSFAFSNKPANPFFFFCKINSIHYKCSHSLHMKCAERGDGLPESLVSLPAGSSRCLLGDFHLGSRGCLCPPL